MFNIENKISRWLKDKEPKWLPQISELYIPKIESELLEFDPRWYEKYCEYLNSETAYYDAIRAGESPLAYIGSAGTNRARAGMRPCPCRKGQKSRSLG